MSPTAANLAAAVQRTLDDLGIGEYHVAGYSLGARVAIQIADSGRVRSVIAIAPDGLGTPTERMQGYLALVAGRGMAMTLAPAAGLLSMTPAGRSVFFAGSRTLPWQLTPADARQLLTEFAEAPASRQRTGAGTFEVDTGLHRITGPVLILQGTAAAASQVIRYLPVLPQAQLRWVPGSHHVAPSDAPATVTAQIVRFLRRYPLQP